MPARRILTAVLDVIVPGECAGCGLPGEPLCNACTRALPLLDGPACRRCGYPAPRPLSGCGECIPGIGWARQAVSYTEPIPRIVSALKDHHRRVLAHPLAALMTSAVPRPEPGAVLVPVPLGPRRQAERGFNQAELLGRHLATLWGLPVTDALRRDDGAQQRGSPRAARLARGGGDFRLDGPAPLHAVLVDDVITTGATLTAAARALRAGGSARVGAVALARVTLVLPPARVGTQKIQRGGHGHGTPGQG
jgi:ComF family protein